MPYTYVDLVTDTGQLIRIECPDKHEDELYETLENAMRTGDWWTPARFDGCTATFMGMTLNRVAMKKVVGLL